MNMSRSHALFALTTVALVATLAHAAAPPPPPRPAPPPPAPVAPPVKPTPPAPVAPTDPVSVVFTDDSGQITDISQTGAPNLSGPFFVSLGSNGRACVTCHEPDEDYSVTPANLQARFAATNGTDPIFALVDGANSPTANVSTLAAKQSAYSMLLTKGLIRIGLPIPANAEFELAAVDDPYDFASASELSLFRRPLATTNLKFLSTVMWDGRETVAGEPIVGDLTTQASDAVLGHEQGATAPTSAQLAQILSFEDGLFTAQSSDASAGSFNVAGATGGPASLVTTAFSLGINDPFASPSTFNPHVFGMFDSWLTPPPPPAPGVAPIPAGVVASRESIARGEQIFDGKRFTISNIAGLTDMAPNHAIVGTCTTCHNTPDAGSHSSELFIDLGLTDSSRRTADMPLYTLRNLTTSELRETTDPGRALVTGKWVDIGKFKVPTLRGLPGRSPYFHNALGTDQNAVVTFYNTRFNIGLSTQEKTDLAAFIESL